MRKEVLDEGSRFASVGVSLRVSCSIFEIRAGKFSRAEILDWRSCFVFGCVYFSLVLDAFRIFCFCFAFSLLTVGKMFSFSS